MVGNKIVGNVGIWVYYLSLNEPKLNGIKYHVICEN